MSSDLTSGAWRTVCRECHGTGRDEGAHNMTWEHPCWACSGSGFEPSNDTSPEQEGEG